MNKEERYYVPTIEEFCIGFEFEYRPFDSQNRVYVEHWVKKTFKAIGNLDRWQDKYLRDGVVRVKRLDREDIESLGGDLLRMVLLYSGLSQHKFLKEKDMYLLYVKIGLVFMKKITSMYLKDKSPTSMNLKY